MEVKQLIGFICTADVPSENHDSTYVSILCGRKQYF